MGHPFDHPALSKALERVVGAFKTKSVSVLPGAKLLFVCGGPTDPVPLTAKERFLDWVAPGLRLSRTRRQTMRGQFLDWAATNMPTCRTFLAEKAAQDVVSHDNPPPLRLAKFEEFLGSVADCVIVFPESVGSFAETGYFAAKGNVRCNCLIVNSASEQKTSFLNRGPIDEIERHTKLEYKRLVLNFDATPPDFAVIKERIENTPPKGKTGVSMHSFNELTAAKQLAFLLYLMSLFPTLDLEGMRRIIELVFGKGNYEMERVRQLLSVLVSAKYVDRLPADNDYYYLIEPSAPPLLEIAGENPSQLLVEHSGIYSRYFPNLVRV